MDLPLEDFGSCGGKTVRRERWVAVNGAGTECGLFSGVTGDLGLFLNCFSFGDLPKKMDRMNSIFTENLRQMNVLLNIVSSQLMVNTLFCTVY